MSDSASIVALVNAARRRLRMVAFVRLAVLIVPSAIAAVAVVVWLARPVAVGLGGTLAATTVLALISAAVASVSRTPERRAAAAAVDRQLHLEDRLVTAMTCLAETDVVARLVLRDAAARTTGVRLSRVFPIEMPSRFVWVLLAASGAVGLASTRSDSIDLGTANQPGAGIIMAGGRAAGAPARGPTARDQTDTPTNGTGVTTARSAESTTPPRDATRPSSSDSSSPANTTEDSALARTPAGSAPARGVDLPAAAGARASRDGEHPDASGRDGQHASTGGSTSGASAGSAGHAQGGSGSASLRAVSAGGIAGGTLTARPPNDSLTAPLDRESNPARYAEALAQAQAAIGHAQVSTALREYMKRYFASIHPDQIK